MHPGDFIITPYMAWHDHGNHTDKPMFWLDGLDIPIIQMLDASFIEHHDEEEQPIAKPVGDSSARYGANLLPVDHRGASSATSPIFNYPYARTREALAQLAKAGPLDPCHGIKMRYTNPVDRRSCHADHGHLHPAPAQGLQDRPLSLDRRHRLRRHGGPRPHARRRASVRLGAQGHLRGAELEAGDARGRRARACCSASPTGPVQEKIGVWREDRGNA